MGKKQYVSTTILKSLENWLSSRRDQLRASCLDDGIQLRAFAVTLRGTVPLRQCLDHVAKCFDLDSVSDPQPFLTLIRQILEKKDYAKVHSFEFEKIFLCLTGEL